MPSHEHGLTQHLSPEDVPWNQAFFCPHTGHRLFPGPAGATRPHPQPSPSQGRGDSSAKRPRPARPRAGASGAGCGGRARAVQGRGWVAPFCHRAAGLGARDDHTHRQAEPFSCTPSVPSPGHLPELFPSSATGTEKGRQAAPASGTAGPSDFAAAVRPLRSLPPSLVGPRSHGHPCGQGRNTNWAPDPDHMTQNKEGDTEHIRDAGPTEEKSLSSQGSGELLGPRNLLSAPHPSPRPSIRV